MSKLYLVIAGIPSEIESEFTTSLIKAVKDRDVHLLALLKLGFSQNYTKDYAKTLYDRFTAKLKERECGERENLLRHANVVLLYLDKQDESETVLTELFGIETLMLPLVASGVAHRPIVTRNQRNMLVNQLIKKALGAMRHARRLLSVVVEEVTNRDNKTCLLLPPRTFGPPVQQIVDQVQKAGRNKSDAKQLRADIERIARLLPKHKGGYFKGRGGIVFQTPAKACSRHGLAPTWDGGGHDATCVIRGRLRFGAPFDPKFHYDCQVPRFGKRDFPGCHETAGILGARDYVNVAPNDNARKKK